MADRQDPRRFISNVAESELLSNRQRFAAESHPVLERPLPNQEPSRHVAGKAAIAVVAGCVGQLDAFAIAPAGRVIVTGIVVHPRPG